MQKLKYLTPQIEIISFVSKGDVCDITPHPEDGGMGLVVSSAPTSSGGGGYFDIE